MPVNRYFNPRVYEGALYAPPVDFIAGALEQAQKKYDVNYAAAEKLRNQYIQSREQDRARANEIQADINKKVDAIAAKYAGDYSAATKDLVALQSEIGRTFGPGGEAAAIQGSLAIQQKSLEEEQNRLAKGEITQDQYSNLQGYYKRAPKTEKNQDGTWSVLSPVALAKYVDHSKIYKETLDKTKPRTISYDYLKGKDGNGNLVYETVKQQGIDPGELSNKFQADLLNDDAFLNYVRQTAQMSGADPEAYMQAIINEYNQYVIPRDSGLFEDTRSTKLYDDFNYREGVKFAHQKTLKAIDLNNSKALAKYKKDLDTEAEMPATAPSLLAPFVGNNTMYKPVSPDITVHANVAGFQIPIGSTPRSVDVFIKKGQDPTVNVPLLASIKEAHPSSPDTDLWTMYNDAVVKNRSNYNIGYTEYQTTSSQWEEANRLMPSLVTGRARVSKIDSKTGRIEELEPSDVKELAKGWTNKNNPSKSAMRALGKSRVSTGGVPFGTVMPDPNGGSSYYIVHEDRADILELADNSLKPAFDFIQDDKRRQGDAFYFYVNDKPMAAMGRKEYWNGQEKIVYYPAYNASGRGYSPDLEDPLTKDGKLITPQDIEDILLSRQTLHSLFPAKTSKSLENELERQ